MKFAHIALWILLLAVAFWFGRCTAAPKSTPVPEAPAAAEVYTCSMHPQIRRPEPGKCPICFMDLVLEDRDRLPGRQTSMSEEAKKLAGIETAPVTREFVTMPVRMVGKVDYDETAVRSISARVAGRIERMFVDYAGVPVKTGDHLVSLYSPDLLTAQLELLEAKKGLAMTGGESSSFLIDSSKKGYASAREKLQLWGLTVAQIDEIETRGKAEDRILINSPDSGVVVEKFVNEGDYVKEGTKIYRIADLDKLWLWLDCFEQDLPWLRYGQQVSVQAEAVPGEIFEGWISFLDPMVDERTRTLRVRVKVADSRGRLKPGMFVRAVVRSRIAGSGRVLASHLAGKWISPMHPEIVKDAPGKCDICGMDLVPAAELGYVAGSDEAKPLVVPATAVLVTGTRAVVYVAVPGAKRPTFEGREIVLGARAGDRFLVRSGLAENEQVVVHGAFRIDSSMQIQAKPSMMSMPDESDLFLGAKTAEFRRSLGPLFAGYFALQKALAGDDLAGAKNAAEDLRRGIAGVVSAGIPRRAEALWREEAGILSPALERIAGAEDLAPAREFFDQVSRGVLALEAAFRHPSKGSHFEVFCPMAFDNRGAAWLQTDKVIANPYFGASMLGCGEVRTEFAGEPTVIERGR